MARQKQPDVGPAIQRLMDRHHLEPRDIYKAVGRSQQTVYTWLNGPYTPQLIYLPQVEDGIAKVIQKPILRGKILLNTRFVASLRDQLIDCEDVADILRPMLVQTYDSLVAQTKEMELDGTLSSFPSATKMSRAS